MENKYKPSKKFTDQAWSEMKVLLDKEMPDKGAILLVPNQERRKRFLLLLPLLLLLGIAALFFYYQSNSALSNEMTIEPNGTTELAILSQNENAKTENTAALEEVLNESTSEKNQLIDNSSNVSIVGNATTTNKVTASKSNNQTTISSINTETQLALSNRLHNEREIINTSYEKEIQKVKELKSLTPFISDSEKFYAPLEEVIEENKEEEIREPITAVTAIDGILLNPLALNEEKSELEEFVNIAKLRNRLPIYAFIGARNYDFSDNIDLVANVETVFRKGNKKLGWRTGINYAQRSTTYLTREQTIADTNFSDEMPTESLPVGVGSELADAERYYASREQLNADAIKYHFLEIPVFLDYKFSKKWSMHAGLSAKALIYSSSQNFGLLNGFGKRSQDSLIEIENTPVGDTSSTSYFAPQKFNFGASVGLNFMATTRLGLQARFSQNLRDVYPELNGNQRSSSIELGLSWRLR